MMKVAGRRKTGDAGVALVAVLWIVAALSILVTGMVQAQRDEIKLVASGRQLVQGAAIGTAAVQLVLQELAAPPTQVASLRRVEVRYDDTIIPVEVMPLNGLIDLNRAAEPLLVALFGVAGGLSPDLAAAMAKALVASRQPGAGRARGARYEAVEDLLQLQGMDFDLYARLAPLVTTDSLGRGRVNPMAAPEDVLVVLAKGDAERAARIAAQRDAGEPGIDTTNLTAEFLDNAGTARWRVRARVLLADGRYLISTRVVNLNRTASDGVPWQIIHADDRLEPR
jgi:general secretion pathway protein K